MQHSLLCLLFSVRCLATCWPPKLLSCLLSSHFRNTRCHCSVFLSRFVQLFSNVGTMLQCNRNFHALKWTQSHNNVAATVRGACGNAVHWKMSIAWRLLRRLNARTQFCTYTHMSTPIQALNSCYLSSFADFINLLMLEPRRCLCVCSYIVAKTIVVIRNCQALCDACARYFIIHWR